jgi:hypothetical protein
LLIGYVSVLGLAAVLAVLSRTLMRPAAEVVHGELANTAAARLPEATSQNSLVGDQVAAA